MNIIHILKVIFRTTNLQEQWHRSLRARRYSGPSCFLFTQIILQKHWCMGTGSEGILQVSLSYHR